MCLWKKLIFFWELKYGSLTWALGSLSLPSIHEDSLVTNGADPGGEIWATTPLKPAKVTLFTIIFYNPGNNNRDIRQSVVLSQQFCEVYFISLTVAKPSWDLTSTYYRSRLPDFYWLDPPLPYEVA